MPEPKKPKRKYEAQAGTPLPGLRLERAASAKGPGRKLTPQGEAAPTENQPSEQDLVTRLIDFIKTM